MTLLKGFLTAICVIAFITYLTLLYLLQPSGQLSDFSQWQEKQTEQKQTHQGLTVKSFGVSTLLFDDGKNQILIDGFFSRPSVAQVAFQNLTSDEALIDRLIQENHLERVKAILVTHSHYDHTLDIASLGRKLSQAQIIGSSSTLNIAKGGHVPTQQLQLAESQKSFQVGDFNITPIESQHTPPTVVNDDLGEEIAEPLPQPARFYAFKEGGSFDYLIEHQGAKILVKASTGFVPNQLKDLKVDILFLGIAQLSKQSPEFQQRYLSETIAQLRPAEIIPIHWDNFFTPLSQPRELLPRIADRAPESLKIVIDYAKNQNRQITILGDSSAYRLLKYAAVK